MLKELNLRMLYQLAVMIIGICKNCGKSIKYGEWYATTYLHYYCCSMKNLRNLKEEGEKRFREGIANMKKEGRKMGSHFGISVDEFCLEK